MRRLEMFGNQDYEIIKQHLEKMALKGYKLKKIGILFWEYEKINPCNLCYDVAYFPGRDELDNKMTKKDIEFIAYCEESGWKYLTGSGQMRVFFTDKIDNIPIDTDEKERFTYIDKISRKNMWMSTLVLFILLLFLGTNIPIREDGIERIPQMLLNIIYIIGVGVLLPEIAGYWEWNFRAKRSIENGLPLPNRKILPMIPFMWGMVILMITVGILWFVSIIYINSFYRMG